MVRVGPMLLILSMCSGCAAWRHREDVRYETIQANPHRDSERARELTEHALQLIEHGKPAKAEQMLQRALVADVEFGPAHSNLGLLYFQQGKFYLAAWEFEYANRLMPDRAEPLNNLGLVFEEVGKIEEAMLSYHSALSVEPANPDVLGNLARAKLRNDEKDDELRFLLSELLLYEIRPDWRDWAGEQLALLSSSSDDAAENEAMEDQSDGRSATVDQQPEPEEIEAVIPEELPPLPTLLGPENGA